MYLDFPNFFNCHLVEILVEINDLQRPQGLHPRLRALGTGTRFFAP